MLRLRNRGVIKLWGQDAAKFLHNITTNDVLQMVAPSAIYNIMLNAKGRFLHDFFLVRYGKYFLLDCEKDNIPSMIELIRLYRVHLGVKVRSCEEYSVAVNYSVSKPASGETHIRDDGVIEYQDPRARAMGIRYMIPDSCGITLAELTGESLAEYNTIRIENTIPDCAVDMISGESFALHFRLDRLGAISHTKGCYTGQEVTARMYRLGAKKMLYTVFAAPGTNLPQRGTIVMGSQEVGHMLSAVGHRGLCLLNSELVSGDCAGLKTAEIALTLKRDE
ncbi:YgfZ/GcvT domain-containing protein [Candidatus Anaplasma sp. TIGMIC]|uniref:CAF17-like 4Fe-4S cluster assembly/insertion protein YgfZ n=1 Tax=Candidatus Anaplasma sp. TIGMIC TaxID=3020713 RepID=UPI00232F6142|nr:folate-binding protein [Candidatus Anaplasma sp. TIGMIC]MDB1135804.1 folate-binding protein [Candidatus Anaplasma sp. TIGMIC]